jgi:hypothetical protein
LPTSRSVSDTSIQSLTDEDESVKLNKISSDENKQFVELIKQINPI